MTDRYLSIYLKDHLAMATGGIEFMKRAAKNNQDHSLGEDLSQMVGELEEERDELKGVMDRVGVDDSQFKKAGAWLAEKAGRLKFNGQIIKYSPLSRVLEVEFLLSAVQARKSLWRTITDAEKIYPSLQEAPSRQMIAQADGQLVRLERMHRRALRDLWREKEQEQREDRHAGGP